LDAPLKANDYEREIGDHMRRSRTFASVAGAAGIAEPAKGGGESRR
jgi:hypothetical protein